MNTAKGLLLAVLGLFILGVGCGFWIGRHSAADRDFKIQYLHTNDWSGIAIIDTKTEQPILVKWDFGHDGNSIEKYFSEGNDIFDVALNSNLPPVDSVYLRGSDKSMIWWIARSGTNFDDRVFTELMAIFQNGRFGMMMLGKQLMSEMVRLAL